MAKSSLFEKWDGTSNLLMSFKPLDADSPLGCAKVDELMPLAKTHYEIVVVFALLIAAACCHVYLTPVSGCICLLCLCAQPLTFKCTPAETFLAVSAVIAFPPHTFLILLRFNLRYTYLKTLIKTLCSSRTIYNYK